MTLAATFANRNPSESVIAIAEKVSLPGTNAASTKASEKPIEMATSARKITGEFLRPSCLMAMMITASKRAATKKSPTSVPVSKDCLHFGKVRNNFR